MKCIQQFGMAAVFMLGAVGSASGAAPDADLLKQLAPTGTLRVGIAYAPSSTPIFVQKDPDGNVRGAPHDIGIALAKALGLRAQIVLKATTAELADGLQSGEIDVGFMPVDDERRKILDFSPPYFFIECTYLVAASSDIRTLAEVDHPEVTVVGISGSTTFRAAGKILTRAHMMAAKSVDEAMATMRSGTAQALALTHDSLPALQSQLPGSRILDGAFKVNGVAIALQKGHPAALAYVTDFMAGAKSNGTIRRAFDDAGLASIAVAP